jgi:SAM-dependent methyltransferase
VSPISDAERRRLAATFDGAAELYERARPGFPAAAVDWVLPPQARRVLDLGAGTGKLTASLVERGLDVVAVDPAPSMLAQLATKLPRVDARIGRAEASGLPDADVDAVLVSSAFHWFDRPAADAEIARVLRPGGTVGLLWNRRDPAAAVGAAFDEARAPQDDGSTTLDRRWFGPTEGRDFRHSQTLTVQGFVDLVASRSYVIAMTEPERSSLLQRIRRLAQAEATSGIVELPYLTIALRARRWP